MMQQGEHIRQAIDKPAKTVTEMWRRRALALAGRSLPRNCQQDAHGLVRADFPR
jgi:hypothetical protein